MAKLYPPEEKTREFFFLCVTFTPQQWGVGAVPTLIHTDPHISRSGDSRQPVSMAMQHLPHPTWLDHQRRERPPTPEHVLCSEEIRGKLWLKRVWKLKKKTVPTRTDFKRDRQRNLRLRPCLDATLEIHLLCTPGQRGALVHYRKHL